MSDGSIVQSGTIQLTTTCETDADTMTAILSVEGGENHRFGYTVNEDGTIDLQPDAEESFFVRAIVPAFLETQLYGYGQKPRWDSWTVTKVSSRKTAKELEEAVESSFSWTFEGPVDSSVAGKVETNSIPDAKREGGPIGRPSGISD